MSELEFANEPQGMVKPQQEAEPGPEKAPGTDPGAVLKAPAGPGQSSLRAQAVAQLQRSHGNQYVQRVVGAGAEQDSKEELARAVDSRRGSGQALPDGVRGPMEKSFGQDFSGVRVHTGQPANDLSQQFGAKAFTTGQDIFFKGGAYDPGSEGGQKLLAHELTHVVQQGNAPAQLSGRSMQVSEPGDAGEREADRMADVAAKAHDVQREAVPEEEEPLQPKLDDVQREGMPEEEEPLQPKLDDVQREGMPEEEEPLQPKADDIQRQEEEEEVQPKADDIQRQDIPEEEEPIQAKADDVQRQDIPEEEEPIQAKADDIQRQEIPEEEEPIQAKADNVQRQLEEEELQMMPDDLQRQVEEEEEEVQPKADNVHRQEEEEELAMP